MRKVLSAVVISSFVAAPAFAIEPIKGSITFDGPSQQTLDKTPAGSVLQHQFTSNGKDYREIYVVGADGRPELVSRTASNDS
ncbi:hypothetical protein AB2N04_03715 [Nitratireductor sp. GISD-1A_MAKvit]|uniref:hypothetical protein n=1 Tax=Nitratireductor sp. GISD-1A_MAKvit TaxID=3234198 RepID=UPI0034674A5B